MVTHISNIYQHISNTHTHIYISNIYQHISNTHTHIKHISTYIKHTHTHISNISQTYLKHISNIYQTHTHIYIYISNIYHTYINIHQYPQHHYATIRVSHHPRATECSIWVAEGGPCRSYLAIAQNPAVHDFHLRNVAKPDLTWKNGMNKWEVYGIWQCVKTLYPCSSNQNSWDLWMFIPLKMVFS